MQETPRLPQTVKEVNALIVDVRNAHARAVYDLTEICKAKGIKTDEQLNLFLPHDEELREQFELASFYDESLKAAQKLLRDMRKRQRRH